MQDILNDFPVLTQEDILACLSFAAMRERSMVLIQTPRHEVVAV